MKGDNRAYKPLQYYDEGSYAPKHIPHEEPEEEPFSPRETIKAVDYKPVTQTDSRTKRVLIVTVVFVLVCGISLLSLRARVASNNEAITSRKSNIEALKRKKIQLESEYYNAQNAAMQAVLDLVDTLD